MTNAAVNVWVVEDNSRLRRSLAELVDGQPDLYCSMAVDSCEDFLATLDEGDPPDLVLMDIGLPGISGIEGVSHIHSLHPATKVIILTIHEENEKVFDAICAGASGYLLKPSRPGEIVQAIRDVQTGAAPINPYIAKKILAMFSHLGSPQVGSRDYGLTARERQILQLVVDGFATKKIAVELNLSYHTVCNHLRSIYAKLHVRSRASAVAKAVKQGLV